MRVTDETIRSELLGKGFSLVNGRLTVSRETAGSFLNSMIEREKNSRDETKNKPEPQQSRRVLDGWINNYPHSFYDPETGAIISYNTDSLVKMTAFCNRVGKQYGFSVNVPGYPKDVPPACEGIARFVIGNKFLDGGTYPEPMCRHSAKYLFEMCDILGQKMTSLPVYLSTPLTIGDESFLTVLEYRDRLDSVSIGSMPSFGANTPLSISGGIALVLAEGLLGAIIVNSLTGLKTHIGVSLLPFDFKETNLVFGTPEFLMLHSLCHDFNNALFGRSGNMGSVEIHTQAIHPDGQAAAEKAIAMTAGYMMHEEGESITFRGMGTLGMDEVFSPAQLLVDAELLNYIRRFDSGYEIEKIPDDFLDEIREGIDKSFIPSERTAGRYRDFMYHSGLFTRASFGSQRRYNFTGLAKKAADTARAELARKPEMVLESETAARLDKLLAEAVKGAL